MFAEKSSGEVFLLLKFDEPANPPSLGYCETVWYRKELPALMANTAVEHVSRSPILSYPILEAEELDLAASAIKPWLPARPFHLD